MLMLLLPPRPILNHIIVHIILADRQPPVHPPLTQSQSTTHPFSARMRHAIAIDMMLIAQRVRVWRCPLNSHIRAAHDELTYIIHAMLCCASALHLP